MECVMPRCLFSPVDALYCAKLVHMMHNMSVPFFSSIWYYNKVGAGGGLGGGYKMPSSGHCNTSVRKPGLGTLNT